MPQSIFDAEQIETSIADVLNSRFRHVDVVDVKVDRDVDHDGDAILRVLIVFTGEIKDADAKVVAGATRQLRSTLAEIDDDFYPQLSFVSQVEYENRA